MQRDLLLDSIEFSPLGFVRCSCLANVWCTISEHICTQKKSSVGPSQKTWVIQRKHIHVEILCWCLTWSEPSISIEHPHKVRPSPWCVSIGGSVVECSPATRAARVRFPADATFLLPFSTSRAEYNLSVDLTEPSWNTKKTKGSQKSTFFFFSKSLTRGLFQSFQSPKKGYLPDGESNPGLPRDRRGYLPLYYRG